MDMQFSRTVPGDVRCLGDSMSLMSIHQNPPFQKTEFLKIPDYPRPGYCELGEEVNLLVNHFRTKINGELKVYNYRVVILEVPRPSPPPRGGRYRPQRPAEPKPVKWEFAVMAFWEAMRSLRDNSRIGAVDMVVFDNEQNAWLPVHIDGLRCMVDHPDEKINRKWQIKVELLFNDSYVVNLNHQTAATRAMSELFLKSLVTQRVRYIPARNSNQWEFARRWEYTRGSMFKIPDARLLHTAEDIKRRIFPGIRTWIGLYAGAKSGENDLFMNLGLANHLFYFPNMDLITFYIEILEEELMNIKEARLFREYLRSETMSEKQRRRMQFLVEGIKVKAVKENDGKGALIIDFGDPRRRKDPQAPFLGDRHYRIVGIHNQSANQYFPNVPRKFNYGHNLAQMYHCLGAPLDYPHLPLVIVKSGREEELQPMEVLMVHEKPQRYAKILDMKDLRAFIKKVTKTPDEYKKETDDLLAITEITGTNVPFLSQYGVQVESSWTPCTGRILTPPVIRDAEGKPAEMTKECIYKVKQVTEAAKEVWMDVIITICPFSGMPVFSKERRKEVEHFYENLCFIMEDRGMSIAKREPQVYEAQAFSNDRKHPTFDKGTIPRDVMIAPGEPTIAAVMDDSKKNFMSQPGWRNRRHLILIFTVWGSNLYGRIKQLGNSLIGVATQVVDKETVQSALKEAEDKKLNVRRNRYQMGSSAIYYNIALKINAKLGGVNMKADLPPQLNFENSEVSDVPTVMYVGIDVTHPGSETRAFAAPIDISLAAIVASTDLWGTQYYSEIYAQMIAKETVECFDYQFKKLMFRFHEHNKRFPKHVVIYRDGVSDAEMVRTAQLELSWIKAAWEDSLSHEIDPRRRQSPPTFTYIVVQKRHHTRFIKPVENGKTRYENPSSGTVVDKLVSSRRMFDFWLASHHGAIGTSRMAHYTVVYDEWRQSPDDIYAMTYRLAFLNARCRKPCSLPAPVFYAHLACNHAREIYRVFVKENPMDAYPVSDPPTEEEKQRLNMIGLQRKQAIEEALKVHRDYPGMHFV